MTARQDLSYLDAPLEPTGRPLRWGVVATGSIARRVTGEIASLPDALVHAVSSRSRERAEAFATEFGCRRAYWDAAGVSGYQRLADDPDVDVVYLTTPHGQHHEVAKTLLEGGKHVLVEKAFTVTGWEAEDLIACARRHGRFLMEALWTRFLPAYRRALAVIAAGEIGEVSLVQADLGFIAAADPRHRLWAKADGGGALLDLAVYPLAWVTGALGFPTAVQASGRLGREGVDETTALQLVYPGGRHAQVMVSFVSQTTRQVRICGSGGVIVSDAPLTRPEGFSVATTRGTVGSGETATRHERHPFTVTPYAYQAREVTRCIQNGLLESQLMPLSDTLDTMRLLDEVRAQIGLTYPNDLRAT